jgi:hypothetical protein
VYGTGATILRSRGASSSSPVAWSSPNEDPWASRAFKLRPIVNSIWGSSPTDLWMAIKDDPRGTWTSSMHVYHADGWNDGDITWTLTDTRYNDMYLPLKLWGSSSTDVWAAGMRGRTLHSTGAQDGVVTWEIVENATDVDLNAIWGFGPDDVWVAGLGGTICHYMSDDVGDLRWFASPTGVTEDLHGGWGSRPTDIWVVGAEGTILHGDGSTWTRVSAPDLPRSTTLYGVWGSSADDVWAVGDGVILHRTHEGDSP